MDLYRILINNSMLVQYGQVSLSTTWVPWTRPNITSNGTLGGNSFAVYSNNLSEGAVWRAFNGTVETSQGQMCVTQNNAYIEFYTPTPIKLQSIQFYDYVTNGSYRAQEGTISACNDGTTWETLKTFQQSQSTGTGNLLPLIEVNSDVAYKYFKVKCDKGYQGYWVVQEMLINALYQSSALNTIILPTSYSNSYYGVAFSFISANSLYAYISSKSTSSISLSGVDTSSNSASWITVGF